MPDTDLQQQLDEAREAIQALQEELAETNSGLVALTLELEQRVDDRTAELRAAHSELEKTNSDLMQLTLELEDRVEERTGELKGANTRLLLQSTALESAANAILITNREGCIVWANPAFTQLTGFELTEVLGLKTSLFKSNKHDPSFYKNLWGTILSGHVWRGELINCRKDGALYPEEMTITPVHNERGDISHFIAVKQDITERRRAEEELRAKNEELATMSQQLLQSARLATMGELAASIAHELNNPLATVSLRVESLLARAPEGDPNRRPLEVVEQEVERMGSLVAHLLEFSRRGVPQISTVDVRDEIDSTMELVKYRFHKHGVSIEKDFPTDIPTIHADRSQLRQVLLNVIGNAVDAMRETGGTLRICVGVWEKGRAGERENGGVGELQSPARPLSHSPAHIVIEISDTGPGIAQEHLAKVMEPFFTTKPAGQGTGLGLPICKRIVQEHHGAFEIESEVGKGTTVRITLPVANGKNGKML
ncbi:MAG: PAS domain S-box protein [Armatimonadetes bacterium]|nr:PAS domain S-box protein [Armatimonadota bacterium]